MVQMQNMISMIFLNLKQWNTQINLIYKTITQKKKKESFMGKLLK